MPGEQLPCVELLISNNYSSSSSIKAQYTFVADKGGMKSWANKTFESYKAHALLSGSVADLIKSLPLGVCLQIYRSCTNDLEYLCHINSAWRLPGVGHVFHCLMLRMEISGGSDQTANTEEANVSYRHLFNKHTRQYDCESHHGPPALIYLLCLV